MDSPGYQNVWQKLQNETQARLDVTYECRTVVQLGYGSLICWFRCYDATPPSEQAAFPRTASVNRTGSLHTSGT